MCRGKIQFLKSNEKRNNSMKNGHHHHPAASAGSERTIPRHTGRSAIAAGRSSIFIFVSLDMTPGYVNLFEWFVPGGVQRISEETISSSALKQCPANWTLLWISLDVILGKFL